MEKRLVLAFVLSFLVLLLWSYLSGTKKEQVPEGKEGITQENPSTIPETGMTRDSNLQIQDSQPVPPSVSEEEIKVDTPLYQAVFTNKGATIKSFKLKKYKTTIKPDSPLVDLINITDNSTDFLSVNFNEGGAVTGGNAVFYSASQESIKVDEGASPRDLTFTCPMTNGVSIAQTFRFYPDKYTIDLYITLINNSGTPVSGNIRTSLKNMLPEVKKGYSSFTGASLLLNNGLEQIKYTKMKKEGKTLTGQIGWVAYESGYFISSIIPEDIKEGGFYGLTTQTGIISATYISPTIFLNPSVRTDSRFTLYFGPKEQGSLKSVGNKLEKAINFGWFDIIAKPLHYLLCFFYKYVHNYGVSIILLTILIKILFWPLTHKSYVSMKEMQKIQPLMAKIRDRYKDDREQMQREMMNLYKTYKVNPMGGCLPMLIQIPVFFALYRILGSSIELRQAPFMLWITDLSAPDRLFNFPFSIPFMSPPYGIPVLTLLMGASMYLQQKMSPPPGDPAQAKMMMFLPILFTVMFINFQSGLVLYWLVNNVISIGQQYRIKKISV
jgi:YidC/Oxa1 family membrane protein insertase